MKPTHRHQPVLRAAIATLPLLVSPPLLRADTTSWLSPVSGTWSNPANWSATPTSAHDAYLSAAGPAYTVTVDAPATVNSVNLTNGAATLRLAAGTLNVPAGINLSAGSLTLAGGSFAGPLTISGSASVSSTPALTLANSSITFAGPGSLNVGSTSTLGGTGQIVFDNTHPTLFAAITATTNLTIAPGITLRTGDTPNSSGVIGNSSWALVNKGAISAQTPGSVLTLTYATLSNTGTIHATNNATIRLSTTNTPIPTASLPSVTTSAGGRYFLLGGNVLNAGDTLNLTASRAFGISTGTTFTGGSITSADDTPFAVHTAAASATAVASITGVDVDAPVLLLPGSRTTLTSTTLRKPLTATSATLTLSNGWSLAQTGSISLTGGSLTVNATPPAVPGPISLTNASLTIRAPLTAAQFNAFSRNASTTNLAGSLDNTGNTLEFNDTTGPLRLLTFSLVPTSIGAVRGGTLSITNPANFLVNNSSSVFDSLSLKGSINLPAAPLTITGSLTLVDNSRITLVGPPLNQFFGNLNFSGTNLQVSGTGEIVADEPSFTSTIWRLTPAADSYTFGPGITVRTGAGSVDLSPARVDGLASAQTAGRFLRFITAMTLNGTVEAKNGGTVDFYSTPNNLNPATSTLTGGTFNIFDASTLTLPAGNTISTNAASITLSGPTSSFPALAPLSTNAGSLTLTASRSFTTQSSLTNPGAITLGPSASLTVTGALTNPGTITLDPAATLTLLATPAADVRDQLLTSHLTPATPNDPTHRLAYLTTSNATTVHHALTGDANLSGTIDPDDYTFLDRSLALSLTNALWTDGDFNYDGVITPQDYLLIDQAFLSQAQGFSPGFLAQRQSQFGAHYVSELLTSIPEPTLPSILYPLSLFLLPRPRRPKQRQDFP